MTTTFVLIASGILIGAGMGVIWRDVRRSRRKAFVLQRDLSAGEYAEAEITISHRPTMAPAAYAGPPPLGLASLRLPLMQAPPRRRLPAWSMPRAVGTRRQSRSWRQGPRMPAM